jgi:hypothetical protein
MDSTPNKDEAISNLKISIQEGPRWLQNWQGLRFKHRFTLTSRKFNPNDLLICAAPLAYWFDKEWEFCFPFSPRHVPFSNPKSADRYLYAGYSRHDPDDLDQFLAQGSDLDKVLELVEATQGPYIRADLYKPTSMDPDVHPLHLIRKQTLDTGKHLSYFNQHVLVYALPELSLIQKDYIGDFLHLLRDQLLEQQDSHLQETHPNLDPDEFDLRLDSYPLPDNELLDFHVRCLVLHRDGDNFYLIIGCDSKPALGFKEAPSEIEIMANVYLDADDNVQDGDEESISTLDGETVVLYHLSLQQIL